MALIEAADPYRRPILATLAGAVNRRDRLSAAYLDAFDRALEWTEMGRISAETPEPADQGAAGRMRHPA